MTKTPLHVFVEDVMNIATDYAGMGGASSAIIGMAGMHHQVIDHLRKNTLAFAAAYGKPDVSKERLQELAGQLEGSLHSLKTIDALSDERLEQFIAKLQALLTARNTN